VNRLRKKTAVIGCGWFGSAHCRVYSSISDLVAVCDVDDKKAKKLSEEYRANWYTDPVEMFEKENVDAVSVVVPPEHIPRVTKVAAEYGVDVLMEKPLGTRLDDVKNLMKYTKKVRIMPGFIELFNPMLDVLVENLENIGDTLIVSTKRIGLMPRRHWQIGVILDLAFHDLYVLDRLFGDVRGFHVTASYIHDDKFEDYAIIILEFKNGIKGLIEANWLTPFKERKIRVYGSKGTLEGDFITQEIRLLLGLEKNLKFFNREISYKPIRTIEPLKIELEKFLYEEEDIVTLEDGIRILELALNICKKAYETKKAMPET